ncbi:Aristolochene synthase [Colletotrichum siamense]|uniref:Aristolochene synthase n=1 Tax=Colletotrichum siamense TaxID=690259 RepID=A0A9P5EJQ8_COLSI|nr:Aristolochene synthase [Colletotrichum siamense]KAF4847638.1 Aristolochene synthase [Colletotrichum siamense]
MREKDRRLADQVLEPTFIFMRAKTEKIRTEITEIGRYLQYRERDVGKALLSTLMRFAMDVHLSDEEVAEMREVEMNSAKHISIVNDIYNWEKELKESQIASEEGSILCSGVKVLANSTGFCIESAKTCLLPNA